MGHHLGLTGLQPGHGLLKCRHQPQRQPARQPEAELFFRLCVDPQQQTVLAVVVADIELVDLHALILGKPSAVGAS